MYKLRHSDEIMQLRSNVYPSDKGNFSLAPFDKNKCIFVHITKTAGTSVALALFDALPYHYQAWQYKVFYGAETFEQYYKFAFVRNPWDRVYSAFCYLKGGGWNVDDKRWAEENLGDINDFNQFIMEWLIPERLQSHIHFWPQYRFICDKRGKPMIDYLAYFETINEDYDIISRNIAGSEELAHKNSSNRTGYKEVYSEEAKQKVAKLYADDISYFGYRFDGFNRKSVMNGRFVNVS